MIVQNNICTPVQNNAYTHTDTRITNMSRKKHIVYT